MGAKQPLTAVSVHKIYSLRNARSSNFGHTYMGHSLSDMLVGLSSPESGNQLPAHQLTPVVPWWSFSLLVNFVLVAITRSMDMLSDTASGYFQFSKQIINASRLHTPHAALQVSDILHSNCLEKCFEMGL